MKISIRKILLILLCFSLFSCKKEKINNNFKVYTEGNGHFKLDFKDSIYIDEVTSGFLNYDTKLDTLKIEDIDKRYIFLHLKSESDKRLSFQDIKSKSDWIYVDSLNLDGHFKFKVLSKKSGYNIMNLAIEDVIILNKKVDDKVRVLTNELTISKEIYVKGNYDEKKM